MYQNDFSIRNIFHLYKVMKLIYGLFINKYDSNNKKEEAL